MAGNRKQKLSPDQLPLITPDSDWVPPTELPDLRGRGRTIAIDAETKDDGIAAGIGAGWAYKQGHICGVAAAWGGVGGEEVQSLYASIRHPETQNFDRDQVARWLDDHFRDPQTRIVCQNGGYDFGWFQNDLGVAPPDGDRIDDTQAAAVMVDENRLSYKLDDLCRWHGVPGKDEALLREAASAYGTDAKGGMWRMPARYVGPYAAQDGVSTLLLHRSLHQVMTEEETLGAYGIECALIPMIMEMRRRGVRLDISAAHRTAKELEARRDEVLANLSYRVGRRVEMGTIDSPRHMEAMFSDQGIEFPRTEKTNQGSFQNDWMKKHNHWLPQMCAQASRLHMAADKFVRGFLINFSHKGRLHAEIHQFRNDDGGTRSHRFSYANPPLQQMPARDAEMLALIRGLFLPEEGELWGAHDYCHDDETEVLTATGWVLFSELGNQDVAQYHNDTGGVTFAQPLDRYVGEARERSMVHVKGPRQLDFRVTEDHVCLRKRPGHGEYSRCRAGDITEMSNWIIPQAGIAEGGDDSEDADIIRLVVAIQADAADRGSWVFYLRKERKIERLRGLIQRLGLTSVEKYYEAKGQQWQIVVRDTDPRVRKYLLEGKVFATERLLALSPRLRQVFLDELSYWDGKIKDAENGHGPHYGSVVRANADAVQAVAAITGRRATGHEYIAEGKKIFYHVKVAVKGTTYGTTKMSVTRAEYHGRVYCLTMPSGYLITRRRGHVLVSGNSQQEYRLIVHYAKLAACDKAEEAILKYRNDPKTDFHSLVAELTGLERKPAKDTNFAKAFGAGVGKFALMTGKSHAEAKAIMEQYDREMPFVAQLGRLCQSKAEQRGWIRLIDGALSHFDMWEPARRGDGAYEGPRSLAAAREKWEGQRLRRAFVHKAMNRLIQGSAARQTKMAMLEMWRQGVVPLIQMHDEVSCSQSNEAQGRIIAEIMRDIVTLQLPVAVDSEYGTSWGTAVKVEGKNDDGSKKILYGASWSEAERLRAEGKYWEKEAA